MDEGMCFGMRGEGVYIGKKKKSEMMSGRKIMKVEYVSVSNDGENMMITP
ncbi:hypothetical protein RchiOBHm_Chr2g0120921 [Rosa chinensis]|uniref:Uncharacterized protein n=1 Tax=Rosa chinensis TaxID=74649 RepID=A0A2P6RSD1_ROSCH|nr:hypothetical protein RchiOBHm_Chr2g0120921 [Rosa chinensis]